MISQLSDLFETLSTLNDIPCPSGKETAIQDVCKNLINPYINHIDQDVLYNQISWLKTESEKTVMLSAHIDEISFIVKNVDKRGFIWIQ
jgi:endoglucanase